MENKNVLNEMRRLYCISFFLCQSLQDRKTVKYSLTISELERRPNINYLQYSPVNNRAISPQDIQP